MQTPTMLDWIQRRIVSNRIYPKHSDCHVPYTVHDVDDDQLIINIVNMFNTESTLVFPEKFIFCQIVYSYYLNRYFGLDFRQCLNDRRVNYDMVHTCWYDQKPNVYDGVIKQIDVDNLDQYQSVKKTRLYFKQEFLIYDEDWTSIDNVYNISQINKSV